MNTIVIYIRATPLVVRASFSLMIQWRVRQDSQWAHYQDAIHHLNSVNRSRDLANLGPTIKMITCPLNVILPTTKLCIKPRICKIHYSWEMQVHPHSKQGRIIISQWIYRMVESVLEWGKMDQEIQRYLHRPWHNHHSRSGTEIQGSIKIIRHRQSVKALNKIIPINFTEISMKMSHELLLVR